LGSTALNDRTTCDCRPTELAKSSNQRLLRSAEAV